MIDGADISQRVVRNPAFNAQTYRLADEGKQKSDPSAKAAKKKNRPAAP